MIEKIKKALQEELEAKLKELFKEEILVTIEEPKKAGQGDISVPVFSIVKTVKKPLPEISLLVKALIEQRQVYSINFLNRRLYQHNP